MARVNKRPNLRFIKGMLIYALIFIILLTIGIGVFAFFLRNYEKSQISYALDKYMLSLDDAKVRALSSEVVSEINKNLQSEEECVSTIKAILRNSEFAKDRKNSTATSCIYYLLYNGKYVEEMTFTKAEEGSLGASKWVVSGEKLIKESLLNSYSVSIPDNYTLKIGETVLGDLFVKDKKTDFDMLKGFTSSFKKLPKLYAYESGPYVGDKTITILDANGNELTEEITGEMYCLDNCTDKEIAELDALCREFIARYVRYTSNSDGNFSGNLLSTLELVEDGSGLESQLRNAVGGISFVNSEGDYIESIDIYHFMNCGNDLYCCDTDYKYHTISKHGETDNEQNLKLMVRQQSDGSYLAVGMSLM